MSFEISQFVESLDSVSVQSFAGDDAARQMAINAARDLIARLETGHEASMHLIIASMAELACIKIGVDAGLFSALEDGSPKTTMELAVTTGTDPVFLRRVLRQLTSTRVLRQADSADDDSYEAANDLAIRLADKQFSQRMDYLFKIQTPVMIGLPLQMVNRKWHNVNDDDRPPFHDIFGTELDYWAYCREHPEVGAAFNGFMTSISQLRKGWSTFYPLENIFGKENMTIDESTVLHVDLGGGYGKDAIGLRRNLSPITQSGRIIVQDHDSVIQGAVKHIDAASSSSPNIEFMAHDFFCPQPESCKGARTYHLGHIIHDWPDSKCVKILKNIREAMKPGYSKLLITETMTRHRGTSAYSASMDLLMMALFSAKQRSEDDLGRIVSQAGLKITGIIEPPGDYERTIIEVESDDSGEVLPDGVVQ